MFIQPSQTDTIIIGGGLAGLTTAVYLAKSGQQVTLLEKGKALGGRAQTRHKDGFDFNMGPHALYVQGEAHAILKELGVPFSGQKPLAPAKSWALHNGRLHHLPATPVTVLQTSLLSLREKLALAGLMQRFPRLDPASASRQTVAAWIAANVPGDTLPQLFHALARLTAYANAPDELSAAVFLRQLQMGVGENVLYLDGGWKTLVTGLRQQAETAGVQIVAGERATAVSETASHVHITLASGQVLKAQTAVLAVPPQDAAALLPDVDAVQRWGQTAVSVRAASLQIGLSQLPRPDRLVTLGIDQPLYLSVHSAFAQLAPAGGAMIHVAAYLGTDDTDFDAARQMAYAALDTVQPGWRDHLVAEQFLPELVVVPWLARAQDDGLNGRPPLQIPGHARLFQVGDWVGNTGWLADGSMASGRDVARLVIKKLQARQPQPVVSS